MRIVLAFLVTHVCMPFYFIIHINHSCREDEDALLALARMFSDAAITYLKPMIDGATKAASPGVGGGPTDAQKVMVSLQTYVANGG